MTQPWTLAGTLLSCCLYAASFPPVGAFPLAWLALVPLLLALRQVRPGAGAALGLCFGCVSSILLASWLPGMLADFFALDLAVALAAAAGIFLCTALPYAAFGAGVALASQRGRVSPFAVGAAWAACELVRVYGPFENPWGLIAFSQAPWLTLIQSADLVGAVGLGMLIVTVNASVCALLRRERHAGRVALASAVVFVLAWVYGNVRLEHDLGSGDTVAVAVVQGGIPRAARLDPARYDENLARYLEFTRAAQRRDPALVAWPELALQFHLASRPELWQRISETSRAAESDLLVGGPHWRTRLLVREELNSAFLIRAGRLVDRHDKVGLLAFSETRPTRLPLGQDLYRPGLELRPLDTRAGALGVLLCSEIMAPELARRLVDGGARLLANPSNDDWSATRAAADHQVAVAVFRAVENRRPLLRPSTNGRSAIIDAHGRVLALAPYGGSAVLHAEVRTSDAATLYSQLASISHGPAVSVLAIAPLLYPVVSRRRDA